MKKEYWIVLLTQAIYVFLALFIAIILWTILPEASQADVSIQQWKFGGAFAGFVFIWWFLNRTGPIKVAQQAAIQSVQAGILLTPSKKEEYNALFDGFTNCDFFAFNPPFKLEGEQGDRLFEEALATHEKRYLEGGVKSRYLFFDKASYERAQSFFHELATRIEIDKLKKTIKIIYWENPPEVPGYTFFIGYKGQKPFCIFYPSVVMREGLPEAIIYIEGAEDFLAILKRHFSEKWDQAMQNSG